jgi:hypothetical protein
VIYLATPSGDGPRAAIASGVLGQMVTPNAGNRIVPGATWALDNGCFSDRWSSARWLRTLDRLAGKPGCLFAVVPDVVGCHRETLHLWNHWWSAPMRRGYRVAFVAQDGCDFLPVGPRALFIGGTTDWKLSRYAQRAARAAKDLGWWVHMGRVNSLRRLRLAADMGCDSVDGTLLAFGPSVHLPRLAGWLDPAQPSIFGGVA